MSNLYNTHLQPVSHALAQFTNRAKRLHADGEQEKFIRFVLTGEYTDSEGVPQQAFVDPVQNHISEDEHITISRDYDSVLGVHEDILVNGPISVYAVPHPTYALKTSLHIKYRMVYENAPREIEYHHIPNFELGFFGRRHHLNVFFPSLWTPERHKAQQPWHLNEAQRAYWYQVGFRPAIEKMLGSRIASEWPATYRAEELRAQKHGGGYSWTTKMIPKESVRGLMWEVRSCLESDIFTNDDTSAWARDFFVLHTVRGVKHATYHPPDANSSEFFLLELFEDAQLHDVATDIGDWYVDVGIEISSSRQLCLQWMTSTHHTILKQAIIGIDDMVATRGTRLGHSGYYRDMASHLTAVSGFRFSPGPRVDSEYDVSYVQAYTTDKAVVYNPDGAHHAKYLTTREALGTVQPAKTVEGIHDIYEAARSGVSSSARLEVRVPLACASLVLMEFDAPALRRSLCGFTRKEWWDFRLIRTLAISKTLHIQSGGRNVDRFLPESLTLTAGLVWLINGLHARPDDLPASRRLMDAILPVTEEEEANPDILAYSGRPHHAEDGEEGYAARAIPYNPYGCVFLRRLALEGADVPRLRFGGPTLPPSAFKHWFNGMSREEVEAKYLKSGIVDRNIVARIRSTSNKRTPPAYINWENPDEPPEKLFNLGAQGFSLPPPIEDDASDNEDRPSPPPEQVRDLDELLTKIWKQFVVDLTSKSPNPTGMTNASYLKLNDVERASGDESIYRHLRLSDIFTSVYYRNAPSSDWEKSFRWLFPPLGHKITNAVQNYCSVRYYKEWMALLERLKENAGLVGVIRNQFKKRLLQWEWIPNAQQDRMWLTSSKNLRFTRWPAVSGRRPPAPHILIKSNGKPTFPEPEEGESSSSED